MKPKRKKGAGCSGWLIVMVAMSLSYRPEHPWSGIVAGVLVVVGAVLIGMLGLHLQQLRDLRRKRGG